MSTGPIREHCNSNVSAFACLLVFIATVFNKILRTCANVIFHLCIMPDTVADQTIVFFPGTIGRKTTVEGIDT